MGRHAEVRETMADLLDGLPGFVEDCEGYMALYPELPALKFVVNELYIELLGALENIVTWYTQPSRSMFEVSGR